MYDNGTFALVGISVGGTIKLGDLSDMYYSCSILVKYLLISMS